MKVEWAGQHPDEGSIHAWLDGELDASEAALLDEHVSGCAECAARVAEARGLIAGTSRVVRQLDAEPARLIQPASTPTMDDKGSLWRLMRVTPARAGIAAVLLVGLGITLTRSRVAKESEAVPQVATATPAAAPVAQSLAKDGLLDSAISRRLASEHPARAVEPAAGGAIPSAEPPMLAAALPDTTAPLRVAAARAALRARSDSASPPADKARMGFAVGATATLDRVAAAGQAAEAAANRNDLSAKVAGAVISAPTANQCYLIESNTPGARWGTATLPMVLAFDSAGTVARVLTPGGTDTEMRAVRTPSSGDSLTLRMRRIGYNGMIAMSAIGDARAGVMRSIQSTVHLEEVVTTSATEQKAEERKPAARSAPQPAEAPQVLRGANVAPPRDAEASMGAAVSITAHTVSCARR